MNNDSIAKLRQQQKLSFALVPLAALMGILKRAGIFAVGTFPWYSEIGLSVFMLIYGISLTIKIRRLDAARPKDDQ